MKTETVTDFVTVDGKRFRDQATAEKHEAEYLAVKPILDRLPNSNPAHGEYVQHDPAMLRQIKAELFALAVGKCSKQFPLWKTFNPDEVHPSGIVGRVLSDYGGPLSDAWYRLACFNFDLGREYDQPYFANNPSESKPAPVSAAS